MGLFSAIYVSRGVDKHLARHTREIRQALDPKPARVVVPEQIVARAVVVTFFVALFGISLLLGVLGVDEVSWLAVIGVLAASFLCSVAVAAMLSGK
jgi:hypothetical protein